MNYTAYLQFDLQESLSSVYSVKLASENPSDNYGILDLTTNTSIVSWGEEIIPSDIGTYSYTFNVENGHIYLVSWEITANAGEDPVYKTDQYGPFFSVDNTDIRAVTDSSGTFIQGSTSTFMLKITNFDGNPLDAETISISIYDEDGSEVILDYTVPIHVDTGFYIYEWVIDSNQTAGEYTIVWNYIVDDIEKAEVQSIVVSTDARQSDVGSMYWGRPLHFRLALEHHLACAQSIPIYFEQANSSRNNKVFRFSFPRWNQSPGVTVYRNQNVVNSGVEVDYFNGLITFDTPLSSYEIVNADYNFKWFSDEDLMRFLNNALQTINVFPPASGYSLNDVPDRFIPAVLYGAAKDALRQLMMCLQFQQPAQIFGGSENAQKAFTNFESLKQNYEKDWEKMLEQKKFGPYPRTRMVVTPEYTLPGGRSLHPETELLVLVVSRLMKYNYMATESYVYTNTYMKDISGYDIRTCSIKEIHTLFHNGYDIEILSQSDRSGNLIFSPINYVWNSGYKTIYNLKTSNGYNIKASDEHLFFVNGRYVPLRDIRAGDRVITCDDHNWEYSTVKSINQLKTKINMYDLEVFGTANLFANGIKCHNSRWFRYLFKN